MKILPRENAKYTLSLPGLPTMRGCMYCARAITFVPTELLWVLAVHRRPDGSQLSKEQMAVCEDSPDRRHATR